MAQPDSRIVRLLLCDAAGNAYGTTDPFPVASRWWSAVERVVTAAKNELGIDVTILRLLSAVRGDAGVPDLTTYLAETAETPASLHLTPRASDAGAIAPQPHRMPWAHPGGPSAQLDWAWRALGDRGIHPRRPAVQVRTWNLSSIWRLPTTGGTVWLKAVPPFFTHEGAIIERLSRHPVPRVLARGEGICLLADVDGDDMFEPSDEQACRMVDILVGIQTDPQVAELEDLHLPDWRLPKLVEPALATIAARAADLENPSRRALEGFVAGLPERHEAVLSCGIPDTLVHGDFHPGNVRGAGMEMTVLDWGDSGIGHPLVDEAAFTQWMPDSQKHHVQAHWASVWSRRVPDSDPKRAAALLAPVAALRQAVIYRHFLDHIEPDERIHHEGDDLLWLRRTAERLIPLG